MMLAPGSATFGYSQRNLPVLASTPTTPFRRNVTYCRTPPASIGMMDEYSASPPPGTAHFQTTSPVNLLRAASVASLPPGVQITRSPSTSTDSEKAQLSMSVPTF